MDKIIQIGNKEIGGTNETFIIAEVSANHLQNFDTAVKIIREAKKAGADAVKIQTYTPDTITLDCDNPYFQITQGTIWDGTTLYKLYESAYTPWDWQPKLKQVAEEEGLLFFSSPFDKTAVDFLEEMAVPVYKIASFEINDIPLIKYVASKNKPMIISTGIAEVSDIKLALDACKEMNNEKVILLKCTSEYPASFNDVNLKTIRNMTETFQCIAGLSDHTMGYAVAVASVAMGAKVVEKHITLSRADGGPDAAFSMEPSEFFEMTKAIREVEKAIGTVTYELSEKQKKSREHSRSLFAVCDIQKGTPLTAENVKSIRPGFGLHTKYFDEIIGRTASCDIKRGTPLQWDLIQ